MSAITVGMVHGHERLVVALRGPYGIYWESERGEWRDVVLRRDPAEPAKANDPRLPAALAAWDEDRMGNKPPALCPCGDRPATMAGFCDECRADARDPGEP